MKHCGTKTIETERLILRRLTEDDAEAMFRNWASDPERDCTDESGQTIFVQKTHILRLK